MFEVTRVKDGAKVTVYSVQMVIAQGALGQAAPIPVFLVYNEDRESWELNPANEFLPIGVNEKEKKPVMGSDIIIGK